MFNRTPPPKWLQIPIGVLLIWITAYFLFTGEAYGKYHQHYSRGELGYTLYIAAYGFVGIALLVKGFKEMHND
jgi:hypothetical protein